VRVFRKTGPRFLAEAAVVLAVPLLTAWLGGSWVWIVGLTFLTWAAIALLERTVSAPPQPAVAGAPPVEEAPEAPVIAGSAEEAPAPEPAAAESEPVAAEAEPAREPESEPEPEPVAPLAERWNVWTLERVQREQARDNEELHYLLVYLREFASPDGVLPPDFDALVRESFGDLLVAAR